MARDIESPTELHVRARPVGITRINRKVFGAVAAGAAVVLGATMYGISVPPTQTVAQLPGGPSRPAVGSLKRDEQASKDLQSLIPDAPIRPRIPDPPTKIVAQEERPPLGTQSAQPQPQVQPTAAPTPAVQTPAFDPYAELRKLQFEIEREGVRLQVEREREAVEAGTVVSTPQTGAVTGRSFGAGLQRVSAGTNGDLLAQAGTAIGAAASSGALAPGLDAGRLAPNPGSAFDALAGRNTPPPNPAQQAAQSARDGLAGDLDPNKQLRKEQFLREAGDQTYVRATRVAPISPFEIKAGWAIPAVMEHGITSDLPGRLTARVTQNVYDSATGRHLLIPQGTRLMGTYDSQIVLGQERLLVAWTRLIFPDSSSFDISRMGGVDEGGYAGFRDQVNNRYGRLFGFAILTSLFSAGLQLSQPRNAVNPATNTAVVTEEQIVAASVGREVSRLGVEITRRNMQIQPTLEIRPGLPFNVRVEQDLLFPRPYADGNLR